MTNEERAREASEKITKASDRYELGRLGLEQIILTALDAATAPLVAERERLRARTDEADKATAYAERLAIALARHWPELSGWKPLADDLIGLLTQIDNMTSGLTRSALAEKEPG